MATGKDIVGGWIHVHEQDSERARIFVPDDSHLPPSRGRSRLRFLSDGSFEELRPGADDRAMGLKGRFNFDGDQLTLSYGNKEGPQSVVKFGAKLSQDGKSLEMVRSEN